MTQPPVDVQSFVDPATTELSEPNAPDPAGDPYRYLPLYLPVGTWPHEEDWISRHKSSGAGQSDRRTYPCVSILEGDPLVQPKILDYHQLDEPLHDHRPT